MERRSCRPFIGRRGKGEGRGGGGVGARRPAINGGGGRLGGAAVSAGEAPGTGVGVRGALKEARWRGAGGSWG
jgi:hypothetical protein